MKPSKPRLLIFIPAYNAARHIEWVVQRIPRDLGDRYDTHVLVIDDASNDGTTAIAKRALDRALLPYGYDVLANPLNRGYGGNQKLGYTYAIENDFDVAVMVHGDGQYPPESAGALAAVALDHGAAFGSRFGTAGDAKRGGMPLYKVVGNRILTALQNRLLGTRLTEFHSGFRAYTTETLRRIPFQLNSDGFQFDTEIFIQITRAGISIGEMAIPTHYGDEECHVNGLDYAAHVIAESVKSRVHDSGFFYEMKFDVSGSEPGYVSKMDFDSPSTRVASRVVPNSTVLDLGSSSGFLAKQLVRSGNTVIGVDLVPPDDTGPFSRFLTHDLDDGIPELEGRIDVVLMMDVIEHLRAPERFVHELRRFCEEHDVRQLFVSTGNVAFLIQRLALLVGQFNYGPRGILDMTHTRLFTFRTVRRLFRQAGFIVDDSEGIPAPIPMAVASPALSRVLMSFNRALIAVAPRLFSYQILLSLRPPEPLQSLIERSRTHARTFDDRFGAN